MLSGMAAATSLRVNRPFRQGLEGPSNEDRGHRMTEQQPSLRLLDRLREHPDATPEGAEPLLEGWYFAILGLRLAEPIWDAASALRLQPIAPRPEAHEIARALKDAESAVVLGRYAMFLGYELAIAPQVASAEEAIELGKSFLSLLRVKSFPDILVPAAIQSSWSATTLRHVPAHSCDAFLLEDNPNLLQLKDSRAIPASELDWTLQNLAVFDVLNKTSPAYNLAVESLCMYNHQSNLRMAAAMLWSGIEALFGIKGELTYRLAAYIAALLESPGPARYELFCGVRKQYNIRSRIVHGDTSDLGAIRDHVVVTREILSRLICRITQDQGVPSTEALDALVLEGSGQADGTAPF